MRYPGGTASRLALTVMLASVPGSFANAADAFDHQASMIANALDGQSGVMLGGENPSAAFGFESATISTPLLNMVDLQDPAPGAPAPPAPATPALLQAEEKPPIVEGSEQAQTARPNINPYNRDIQLTVPLNFNNRVLGEMPVLLTREDRFIVDSAGFVVLINPLLTPEAQAELATTLEGVQSFAPEEINAAGISLDYDPQQLAVLVLRIDPSKRSIESLFNGGRPEEPGLPPEGFSAYLNGNAVIQRRESTGDFTKPSVFLAGAIRFKSLVFEADIQGQEDFFTNEYSVDRRFARFVYDQPEAYRRWFLGDLDPQTRGRQGFVELGGIGVLRQKQRFEPFRNNVLSGNRQLLLREASTVRVLRNGVFVREFRLDPGQYDVSNLPLNTGSNDIQLEVQNDSGFRETIQYSAYLDTIDLEPGDYDYGAYLGVTSDNTFGSPDYSAGELAFSGFYRKAFLNRPAIGVGVQASSEVQNVTGQTQYILANASRLQFDAAASNADRGIGYAYAATYEFVTDLGSSGNSWTVVADYTSENYATLGNAFSDNPVSWTFSSSYSHIFSEAWTGNVSASYRMSRSDTFDDGYSLSATSSYRFTPEWTIQLGAEYFESGAPQNFSSRDKEVGIFAALVWQGPFGRRADARYSTARNSGSVRFQQSPSNRVGSIGYSVAADYNDGAGAVSGQIDYIGSRFDASLSHTAFGRDFNNITEEQVTSLRVGSSIATTGGKVAIGRTISDSFAIVYPHPSLGDSPVIVGDSFEGGNYQAVSGLFGPALSNTLTSYVNQSVRYDALNAPRGYDVGEGVVRVRPTYKSGYAIEVGSAAFVSALGRLTGNENKPLALISGHIRPADNPDAEPQLFFTNSVGRFAIQDLEPGKTYRIDLFSSPALSYEFTVPAGNEGLLDMGVVTVPLDAPEE